MNTLLNKTALPAVLLALAATPALAHASLTPKQAPNGSTARIAIVIPHGCDGAATDTVVLKLPEGFVSAKPMVKPGWTIEVTKGDYTKSYTVHGSPVTAGPLEVKWSGGTVPDDQFDEFVLQGSVMGFDAETSLPFAVTQFCGDASVAWDQIAAPGEDAHALEHPAPTLLVTAAAGAMPDDHGSMSMGPATTSIGDLELSDGFARATLPNAPVGGGFITITNIGSEDDTLIAATSPFAGDVQLHEMKMDGDVMKMQQLESGIPVPAGETVTLEPGGLHLMFMQLKQPFVEGTEVPVTLTFEKAGSIDVMLTVGGIAAKEPAMDHSMHGG